jgi:flavin reductase (DIM6/NTAB) family NADH-FMN oxidoreductase RutF
MADGGSELANAFVPDPNNTRVLRDAFGRFATGVTVVTTNSEDGPVGMTANSFTSVSLDPALVLWSPAKSSFRLKYFEHAEHYAIHVLCADQADVCSAFAKKAQAFEGIDYSMSKTGVPLISNCLARFECERVAVYPGGDHMIVVGQVMNAEMRDGDALTFYSGQMGKIITT